LKFSGGAEESGVWVRRVPTVLIGNLKSLGEPQAQPLLTGLEHESTEPGTKAQSSALAHPGASLPGSSDGQRAIDRSNLAGKNAKKTSGKRPVLTNVQKISKKVLSV
jgi:hypothetical protein